MSMACAHIVDDDAAIRDSLDWLLQAENIPRRIWASAAEFLAEAGPDMAGCVVLDVRMPGMSGFEAYDALRARGAACPVIFLTGHADVPSAVRALKGGAFDFLEKPFEAGELLARIRAALARDEARRKAETLEAGRAARLAALSAREAEVVELMLAGLLNKQIAERLGLSLRTVEAHRARALEKMGARNAVELAARLGAGL